MLAEVIYTGVAAQQAYTITFPFLQQDHVFATLNGVAKLITADYDIDVGGTTLTFNGSNPIANGDRIVIYRDTPDLASERLVDFQNGSAINETDLDTSALQLLYIIQEISDDADRALPLTQDGTDVWDAGGKRITNVGAGIDLNDAARIQDVVDLVLGAGNLPVVTVADNDSGLFVEAGSWAIRTAAQVRAHLGLGTAALVNTGTTNGTVPVLTATGLPAVSGQDVVLTANPSIISLEATKHQTPVWIGRFNNMTIPSYDLPAAGTWATDLGTKVPFIAGLEANDTGGFFTPSPPATVTLLAGTYVIEFCIDVLCSADGTVGRSLRWGIFNGDGGLASTASTADIPLPHIRLLGIVTRDGRMHMSRKFFLSAASPFDLNLRLAEITNDGAAHASASYLQASDALMNISIWRIN